MQNKYDYSFNTNCIEENENFRSSEDLITISNHGCDHDCIDDTIHEICIEHTDIPFQEVYDEYVVDLNKYFDDPATDLTSKEVELLRQGFDILEKYRHSVQELEFYRMKFSPVRPLDMEISNLKKGYIGRCRCGQLLVEAKDVCCPKCHQFIDWTKEDI